MIQLKFGKPLCRSIIAVAIMMLSLQAMAYDFSYTHQWKTLYYSITSDNTVKVTYYMYYSSRNNYVSGNVVIPSTVTYNGTTYSVTSIGEGAFYACSDLTSVTIPNSVTSIGEGAFYACSGLTSVTIPTGVTSIGSLAFYDCSSLIILNFNAINCQDFELISNIYYPLPFGTSLTTVNIGDSVQRIPTYFVSGCSELTSITIPNSVTFIGYEAFWSCSSLTTLNFNAINCQDFQSHNGYDTNNNYISLYPFETSITTVTIGDSVQRIPANFVKGCSGLNSVTISNSVTSIGGSAFYGCDNLSSITSLAITSPAISSNDVFPYPNFCMVTVPCGSLAAYTDPTCRWNILFPQRITESSSFGLSVSANDEAYGRVEVENHSCESKTLTAIANEGYEFTAWNDGNTENPRTVSITSDTAFMAIFTEAVSTPTITLTVNDETMGSATYTLDGNTAVLTATANEGYSFVIWSDGNTENPRTVTITSDTAFMAIFSPASSLQEVNAREFALYPNPAKSFVTLEFETLQENTLLQILDINGRRVRTLDLKAGIETLRIDLGDLPKGVYTVMLGNTTKKLIVE